MEAVKKPRSTGSRRETILAEGLDGYTVVSVRMRNAEFLEFSSQVERAGLKNNKAMRIAARRIAGFLEIDPMLHDSLRNITREIGRISTSLNHIARTAQQNKNAGLDNFFKERAALGREFMQLERQLQPILNISERRQDGLRLLEEASESDA